MASLTLINLLSSVLGSDTNSDPAGHLARTSPPPYSSRRHGETQRSEECAIGTPTHVRTRAPPLLVRQGSRACVRLRLAVPLPRSKRHRLTQTHRTKTQRQTPRHRERHRETETETQRKSVQMVSGGVQKAKCELMSHWSACNEESAVSGVEGPNSTVLDPGQRRRARIAMNSCSEGNQSPLVAICNASVPGSAEVARHH